jgi:hypothetical protein
MKAGVFVEASRQVDPRLGQAQTRHYYTIAKSSVLTIGFYRQYLS